MVTTLNHVSIWGHFNNREKEEDMKEQDKEAFEKWAAEDYTERCHGLGREAARNAWFAALEYKQEEFVRMENTWRGKAEDIKNFWKTVLDKYEKGSASTNKLALDSLTSAFDVYTENEKLKQQLTDSEADWIKMRDAYDDSRKSLVKEIEAYSDLEKEYLELESKMEEKEKVILEQEKERQSTERFWKEKLADITTDRDSEERWANHYSRKLKESLEVIKFYADKNNWIGCENDNDKWLRVYGHDEDEKTGGKRAREFLKKHENREKI